MEKCKKHNYEYTRVELEDGKTVERCPFCTKEELENFSELRNGGFAELFGKQRGTEENQDA